MRYTKTEKTNKTDRRRSGINAISDRRQTARQHEDSTHSAEDTQRTQRMRDRRTEDRDTQTVQLLTFYQYCAIHTKFICFTA